MKHSNTKNSDAMFTKQRPILACITSLLYCAIACSFIFIAPTIAAAAPIQQPPQLQQAQQHLQQLQALQQRAQQQAMQQQQAQASSQLQQAQQKLQQLQALQQRAIRQQQAQQQQSQVSSSSQLQQTQLNPTFIVNACQAYQAAVNSYKVELNTQLNMTAQQVSPANVRSTLTAILNLLALYSQPQLIGPQSASIDNFLDTTSLPGLQQESQKGARALLETSLKDLRDGKGTLFANIQNVLNNEQLFHILFVSLDHRAFAKLQEWLQSIHPAVTHYNQNAIIHAQRAKPTFFQRDPILSALQSLVLHYTQTLAFCMEALQKLVRIQQQYIQRALRNPHKSVIQEISSQ